MTDGPEPSRTGRSAPGGDARVLRLALPFLWPRDDLALRLHLVGALALLCLTALLNALAPMPFAHAVDLLSEPSAQAGTQAGMGAALLLAAYGGLLWCAKLGNELRWALYGPIEHRLRRRMGLSVFRHIHELSLGFHLGRRTGQVSRVLENGLRGVRELLFDLVFVILPLLAEIAFISAVLAFRFPPGFAALALGILVLYAVCLVIGSEWLRQHQRRAVVEGAEAQGTAVDSLLNYETVKYFGNEEHVARRYDQALARVEKLGVRALRWRSLTGLLQASILGAGLLLMVSMAGGRVADGTLGVGDLVLVNTYLLQLIRPLDRLGQIYRSIKQALVDVEQMMELLAERPEVADRPAAGTLPPGPGELRFEGVRFGYDPRRPILRGLDFTLPAGRTVALVGPSGGGKSTVARLLFRFYDVQAGRILLDGRDLRDVTQQSLRGAIGVVPQDAVLFNDTIRYNLAFGRPDASEVELEAAARLARVHDFVEQLPDGYDTVVGERGLMLSGGEKQRIAIARAVLKRPRLFVFDEATSALDLHTERAVLDSLSDASRGTSTLVIAHRLSTIVQADEILVVEDGRIVERGRHAELLARGGAYAALWESQRARAEAAD
jgi:ATP-binding cassette, subfamily B, heavy metal transporter